MYKRILIPIDGSPSSEYALAWGIGFAQALHAEVTFLHVLENPISRVYGLPGGASYVNDLLRDLRVAAKATLANAENRAGKAGVPCNVLMLEGDHPAMAILHKEKNYDLTIMGTHSRKGLDRLFLGSVTEAVLRRSDKPHLILHTPDADLSLPATEDQTSIKQILLPIADATASDSAIEEGLYLAQALHAKVTFLHVLEVPVTVYTMPESMVYEPSIREDLKNAAQETLKKAQARASDLGVDSEARMVDSANLRAENAILEAEVAFDLTVMATHSRRGIQRALLGSVTEAVLRQSSRPHLVVRCRE